MVWGGRPQGATATAAFSLPGVPVQQRYIENLGVSDSFARRVTYKRILADNIGVMDQPITYDVRIILRILTENLGIGDQPNKLIRHGRNPVDSIGISDLVTYTPQTWKRLFSDNIGVTDAPALPLPASVYKRVFSDNLGVSDIPAHGGTYKRTFSDNLGLTDLFVGINKGPTVRITDNLGVADQQARKVPASFRVFSDGLGIADLVSRLANALRSFQESLGVADSAIPARVPTRLIADNLGINDLPSRTHPPGYRSIADNTGISDTFARTGTFLRLITDGIGVADQQARLASPFRVISENIGVGDQLSTSPAVTWRIVLQDNIGLTDLLIRLNAHQRTLIDGVGIADFPGHGAPIQRVLSDSIGVQDLFQAAGKPFGLPTPPLALPPLLARWSMPTGAYGQEWYMVTGRDLTVLFVPAGMVNITGWQIRWQLRYPDGSGRVSLNKDTAVGGLVATDSTNGLIQLTLGRDDTVALSVQSDPWFWELRRYDVGGSAALAKGTLYIDQDLAD